MRGRWTRWAAGGLHLLLAGALAAGGYAALALWYPGELLELVGRNELWVALAIVIAGPMLTFILFRPGKWGLRFDMFVIGLAHTLALSYIAWVFFQGRPVYVAFVKDRFELVRANDIDDEARQKASAPFDALPMGRPHFVAARLPTDPKERTDVMFASLGGIDIHMLPRYYVAYESERREVIAHAKPWSALLPLNPGSEAHIERVRERTGLQASGLGFLPLRAGKRDFAVVIELGSGQPLEIAALKPWTY